MQARACCRTCWPARAKGVDAQAMLANNDAYGFFEATGDLVMTGPTLTNVNDFRAIVIDD
jgi:glycerate 2-kinase